MPIDGAYERVDLLLSFTRLSYPSVCTANGFTMCCQQGGSNFKLYLIFTSCTEIPSTVLPEKEVLQNNDLPHADIMNVFRSRLKI